MKIKSLFILLGAIIVATLAVIFITQVKIGEKLASQKDEIETPEIITIPASKEIGTPVIAEVNTEKAKSKLFSSIEEMVQFGLVENLGRDALFFETYRRDNDQWVILCGRPTELDGSEYDYSRSKYKSMEEDNLMEDKVCMLGEKTDLGFLLRATDLGSLDSPVLLWMSQYSLPSSLFE